MEGVQSANVNLAAELLDVHYAPDAVSLETIAEKVGAIGFEAILPDVVAAGEPDVLRFGIRGMHCAACSGRIERVVGAMEGVASVEVSLASDSAAVHLQDGVSSRDT